MFPTQLRFDRPLFVTKSKSSLVIFLFKICLTYIFTAIFTLGLTSEATSKQTSKNNKTLQNAATPPQKIASVEGITEFRLGNGLRVLLFPDPSRPTNTVNMTYLVGSRHEIYGESGLAHILEHLTFKATKKYNGEGNTKLPADILKELGGNFNGTTSFDRTNYFATAPATPQNLTLMLDLEAQRMTSSLLNASDLWDPALKRGEMTVVRNEYEQGLNSPFSVTYERLLAAAFGWHNYGKPTIGNLSDIENVQIDKIRKFYEKYYQPDNAVLLVAGPINEAEVLEEINKIFGPIPRPTRKLSQFYTAEPAQDGERLVTVRRNGETPFILVGYKVPSGSSTESAPLMIAANILGSSPSGRLYKALVASKSATAVFDWTQFYCDPSLILLGVLLSSTEQLEQVQKIATGTIEGINTQKFTDQEVNRAKGELLANIEQTLNDSERLGVGLSEYMAHGDWRLFFIIRDRIKAATTSDVNRISETYLKPTGRTLAQFIPTKNPTRVDIPLADDISHLVSQYKGDELGSGGEAFDPAPLAIESKITRAKSAYGLTTVFLPKKTRRNMVNGILRFNIGDEQSLNGQKTVLKIMTDLLERGSESMTRAEMQDALNQLQVEESISAQGASISLSLKVAGKNLDKSLKILAEALKKPVFVAKEFDHLKDELILEINQRRTDPSQMAQNALQKHLDPYPEGHLYSTETPDEEIAAISKVTLDEVKEFHKKFLGASFSYGVFVGDFDAKSLQQTLDREFSTWVSNIPYTRVPQKIADKPVVDRTLTIADKASAIMVGAMNMPIKDAIKEYPALLIANQIIGGSPLRSRLADRLRQKEGLSYAVGSALHVSSLDPVGKFIVYAMFNPTNLAKVSSAITEELGAAISGELSASEVADAKKSYLQTSVLVRSDDSQLVDKLLERQIEGRTLTFDAQLEKKITELTAKDVSSAIKTYIDLKKINFFKAGTFTAKINGI